MDGPTQVRDARRRALPWTVVVAAAAAAMFAVAFAASALAEEAPSGPPAAGGHGDGMAALVGFVGYQWLELSALNEQLRDAGFELGSGGYVPGFGVLGNIDERWGFSTAGSELTIRDRGPKESKKSSRLSFNTTEIGLHYRLWGRSPLRLLVGGSVGLASANLEWADWSSTGQPINEVKSVLGQKGGRLTRQLLTLQPQVDLQWLLSDAAGLQLSVGYLLASDFWNPRWAHPAGLDVPGVPQWFAGPVVRLSILVGNL